MRALCEMNRIHFLILTIALTIINQDIAMSQESRTEKIDTPDGQIDTTVKTVDPTPQKITIASAEVVQAFDSYASKGRKFVTTFVPEVEKLTLKDFDLAFKLWQHQSKSNYTEQQVIEILGAYLGSKLIKDYEMEWVLVEDEYGTDYAVRGIKFEVMSFPFSSVLKRIENNENDFMFGVYHTVGSSLKSGNYKAR